VSLDAIDDAVFKRMNDVDFAVSDVLHGIDAAHAAGLGPVKVNMVVKGGMNDDQILPMARHFKGSADHPALHRIHGRGRLERLEHGRSDAVGEVVRRIAAEMPLEPVGANYTGETAARWRYLDGGGEVGMISSVTQAFCTTARASACPPRASSTPACSPPAATTCAPCCAKAAATLEMRPPSPSCGAARDRYSETRTINTAGMSRPRGAKQDRNVLHRRIRTSGGKYEQESIDQRPGPGRRTRHAHGPRRQGPAAFRGSTMAAHVLARLRPQVASVAINANQNLDAYGAFGVPVWPDDAGFAGPLAGLEAGCAAAPPLSAHRPLRFALPAADLAARLHGAARSRRRPRAGGDPGTACASRTRCSAW
jgi:hypothetical protein